MMKDLTKKCLDELAKKLPILTEREQREKRGGSVYVGPYGEDFGRAGLNDALYVLGSQAMYNHARQNNLDNYGISLHAATEENFSGSFSAYEGIEVQKNVFAAYAKQIINYTGNVEVINNQSENDDIYYRRDQSGASGVLFFNNSRSGMIFTEQGLVQELLRVQKNIHTDPSNSGSFPGDSGSIPNNTIKKNIEEIMVLIKEINEYESEAIKQGNTSMVEYYQDARKRYASELLSLWRQQGHAGTGYEIWDAYQMCGVKGY